MNYKLKHTWIPGVLFSFCMVFSMSSCKEDIDKDNYAIAKKETLADVIAHTDSLSDIKYIFDKVTLGKKGNASSLTAVLAARGHYTVFAPTNRSVRDFLKKKMNTEDVTQISDSLAQLLAYNCIIDNGKDMSYETPDFPVQGSFAKPNLNDRLLNCRQDTTTTRYKINENSVVVKENLDAENGTLHIVNHVIAPSADNVAAMVEQAPNMKVMGELLRRTTWSDSLRKVSDKVYEEKEREELIPGDPWNLGYTKLKVPLKRFYGYTIFAEPDDVFAQKWGIQVQTNAEGEVTNWEQIQQQLETKLEAVYGTAAKGDLKNPDNALNRFVAYHILPFKAPYDKLVVHYNEYGYQFKDAHNAQLNEFTVDVYDYYPTMGKKPGLLKVLQVAKDNHEIYLNRVSKYKNGLEDDYTELSVVAPGIMIRPNNGNYDNNAINGYYFPINDILLNDKATQDNLTSERIRFDIASCLPEIISNSIRGGAYAAIPREFCDNIFNMSESTVIAYLHSNWNGGAAWQDYQGDEFLFSGLFDFTLKLPPVPKLGTYEIRLGIAQNELRGMAQLYFGEDPYRLQPAGLPIDMRQSVAPSTFPALNWKTDAELNMDVEAIVENDKNLHNQGFMKAPQYFMLSNGTGKSTTARNLPFGKNTPVVRRIVAVERMEPGKVYYLRFKSALHKTNSQFFLDYFEYVPSNVYNGAEVEDIW